MQFGLLGEWLILRNYISSVERPTIFISCSSFWTYSPPPSRSREKCGYEEGQTEVLYRQCKGTVPWLQVSVFHQYLCRKRRFRRLEGYRIQPLGVMSLRNTLWNDSGGHSYFTENHWWTGRDSNSRPLQCQCSDLPTDLPAQLYESGDKLVVIKYLD